MIKSMTGFGRCEVANEKRKFTAELKSVNHRYLDVNIKMPKKLNFFESAIRNLLKEYIERGKVDVFITYFSRDSVSGEVPREELEVEMVLGPIDAPPQRSPASRSPWRGTPRFSGTTSSEPLPPS